MHPRIAGLIETMSVPAKHQFNVHTPLFVDFKLPRKDDKQTLIIWSHWSCLSTCSVWWDFSSTLFGWRRSGWKCTFCLAAACWKRCWSCFTSLSSVWCFEIPTHLSLWRQVWSTEISQNNTAKSFCRVRLPWWFFSSVWRLPFNYAQNWRCDRFEESSHLCVIWKVCHNMK